MATFNCQVKLKFNIFSPKNKNFLLYYCCIVIDQLFSSMNISRIYYKKKKTELMYLFTFLDKIFTININK